MEHHRRLYRTLRLIRVVEEEVARVYPTDVIKSPVHLSIGQEFIAAGVCDALEPRDHVSITYRGHAAYLAKGGDLNAMIAEMYGKKTGCCEGRGGSMHLVDMKAGVIGASAVVGTSIPVATGFALAARRKRTGGVVVCFIGDGATEEGCFAESLNFAALHKLPILFVCENNGYAIHEPLAKRWATDRLCERVATYGIPARRIEDGSTVTVHDAAAEAVTAMRDGGGPAFLEILCYRWREHVGPNEDFDQGYRSAAEKAPWAERDEVARLAGLLPPEDVAAIEVEITATVRAAFAFAEQSPFPVPEDLHDHVYA
ncbi:thiamine pyrophosphate-dependent dehydrogenase E1 component subunit alpha [Azospirillum agricola]|uniref:thiamine pyrophosphate-dependent dehydrogenase E1 component subunit alpha n=1 Tax=Azospirillum agricola TaxID=1720247 RepID=UPI000A0F098B|nr:thiamine pyrophosphate-dependent dehydrogenase E1 component subunit alpha [Azospirillum agricola]SMH41695.1 pyruvate dehydrogenase E1 component alpha subunit [Azospirillum lipoferum]